MHVVRTFRMSAFVAATALTVSVLGTTAAEAKPNRPGSVTGLTASADATSLSSSETKYDVSASWNKTAKATSYKVTLTKGGTTLASKSVTSTSWSPTVTTTPGNASLSVRAVIGHRQGKPSSVSVQLADVNAPVGTYETSWSNDTGVATLKQDTLSDDGPGAITRTVNWHQTDGSPEESWPNGTTLQHSYPLTAARYVPTVTLTDGAGNHVTIDAPAVVIDDTTAPTAGSYTVSNLNPWATLTKVTVTETAAPTDVWSDDGFITRTVDWGDGSSTSTWTGSGSAHHVYAAAGAYTLTVTDTDEAHNVTTAQTSSVVVKADTVAPKVTISKRKPLHSVAAWRTLKGTATDTAGTGVKSVSVKAVEKRKGAWYGYNARTHKWLKAATEAKAFKRAVAFTRTTSATHVWTAKLSGLTKGTLVARATATDLVGNRSGAATRSASLTQR